MASLFARKHTGDRAFTSLVESQRGPLERYVRGLGASPEDAEEIASAALLRAYLNAPPTLDDADGQRAWLRTVARNLWIDRTRRLRLKLVTEEASMNEQAQHAPAADAGRMVEMADEARSVLAAMALLAPSQRAMLYLREVRGLSYAEIADELGTTLPAVESTLHRARRSLARTLKGKNRTGVRGLAVAPLLLLHRWGGRASAAVHAVPQALAVKVAVPAAIALTAGGLVVTHHVPTLPLAPSSHGARAHAVRVRSSHHGRSSHHRLSAGRHAAGVHPAATNRAAPPGAVDYNRHAHRHAGPAGATPPAATAAVVATGSSVKSPHGVARRTRAHGPGQGVARGHPTGTRSHGHTAPVHARPVKAKTAKRTHTAAPAGSKAHTPSKSSQAPKTSNTPKGAANGHGATTKTTPVPSGNPNANGHGTATAPASSSSGGTSQGNASPHGQAGKATTTP